MKESSSLIGFENFGAAKFSITTMLGWYYPRQSKIDQISTHQRPLTHTKFLHSPHESLTSLYYYLM